MLRKTMLDECKGEKFYEIVALFSNVVLKKVLAAREGKARDVAVARKLATAPMLQVEEQQSLLPLAIAHKAALLNVLKRKEEKRRRYLEFEELLDRKAEEINGRIRKAKETPRTKRPAVSQKDADAVKKQLKDNWVGDQKWVDIMLHGDGVQSGDAFLSSSFDKVWRMVEAGRKLEDVVPEAGLLENLQMRVQEQQGRLEKWKAFHEKMQMEKAESTEPAKTVPKTTTEFKFDDHLQYQLPSSKQKDIESVPTQRSTIRSEYQDILTGMNEELSQVSKAKTARPAISLTIRRTSTTSSRSPVRSRKNTRSESIPEAPTSPARTSRAVPTQKKSSFENDPVLRPTWHVPVTATPADSDATLIGQHSTFPSTARSHEAVERQQDVEPERDATPLTSHSPDETSSSPANATPAIQPESIPHSPEPSSVWPSEPPIPSTEPPTPQTSQPDPNPEDALAEQIVNAIGDATPSPVKKPQPRMSMSLIERTRISMARTTSFDPISESPLPLPSPELPTFHESQPEDDRRTTLLERTRLSMIAMQSKPRAPPSKPPRDRKSSRNSLFPVNQFDTPRNRKSFELIEESKSTDTPKEALFSDEVDYDRVFRSRPRIATSPVWSPDGGEGEGFDEGVTGIDLGDVDCDEDEMGWEGMGAESPSRGRVGRGRM